MTDLLLTNEDKLRMMDSVRDPIRMEIIFLLASGHALNVGEIASRFKISRPAISHHLKVLKDAGVVRPEKTGQEVYYHLERGHIVSGLRQLADDIERCCAERS
jgi:ArsR family transcriptional regulator, arsenate/arsenite/antimonite-responsive transcriptional repressor